MSYRKTKLSGDHMLWLIKCIANLKLIRGEPDIIYATDLDFMIRDLAEILEEARENGSRV